jgi:hypothetical protein
VLALIQHVTGDEPADPHPAPLLEGAHDPDGKRILGNGHHNRRQLRHHRLQGEIEAKSVTAAQTHRPGPRRKPERAGFDGEHAGALELQVDPRERW